MFGLFEKYGRYKAYKRTVEELGMMSNRELADIGISRWDIKRVAREHVQR